jgi:hypothetical protein
MRVDVKFVQIVKTRNVVNMKFKVGIERTDYLAGIIEKEIEADYFAVDDTTKVLYLSKGGRYISAFLDWLYVRQDEDEEA